VWQKKVKLIAVKVLDTEGTGTVQGDIKSLAFVLTELMIPDEMIDI